MNNKISEVSNIQLRVLNDRLKELMTELHEFAILEVEAVSLRDKIKWGLRVAETKELIQINRKGVEIAGECMKLEMKLSKATGFEELMSVFKDMEAIVEILK